MQVELLPNIHDRTIANMPYAARIHSILEKNSNRSDSLRKLNRSHSSTTTKILYADYHFHILNQIYIPAVTERFTETPTWALAEMNSIVINLYSALDSLANEINLAYNLEIATRHVEIYHNVEGHHKKYNKNCVRCKLSTAENAKEFASFLDQELNQQWFLDFRETRRQLVHLVQPIYNVTISVGDPRIPDNSTILLLPNKPCIENPQMADYSKGLDFNTYSQECRINVVTLIEQIYKHLEPRIESLCL